MTERRAPERPTTVYLKDYTAPSHRISEVNLYFDLEPSCTRVTCQMQMQQTNSLAAAPLILDGDESLKLALLTVNGEAVEYQRDGDQLTITSPLPCQFTLHTVVEIDPQSNTALEGLYMSSGRFCTQCEADGFRRITFFLDRPDVLATYTVGISADAKAYPKLLSNGNLIEEMDLGEGRHFAKWHDPFPKPCYLFALVAGDLAELKDTFTTASGRDVALSVYSEAENIDQCDYAMESLKNAMRWDEETYGLEYDLDRYMIVAVNDFNMGAMENKGLNVFNTKFVLASQATATDADYQGVEAVIGHEYFHNWTGNRVTCRDWFQLSLKEGLTVFRDQEFSSDLGSRHVKRIEDVRLLRAHQFREDAGATAHPVRPSSYIELNNLYTLTVYEKGAEIIRMYQSLFGREGFKKGLALYLGRHDGQAATVEDFLAAMSEANDMDLTQFKRWYEQAGTPELFASWHYQPEAQTLELTLRQHLPDTPQQNNKLPQLIPVRMGLVGRDGQAVALQIEDEAVKVDEDQRSAVLYLRDTNATYHFDNVTQEAVPSLLREFSAPVKLNAAYSSDDLRLLAAFDADSFSRWSAVQQLATNAMLGDVPIAAFVDVFGRILTGDHSDPSYSAELLSLPALETLFDAVQQIDIDTLHSARQTLRQTLAETFAKQWQTLFEATQTEGFDLTPDGIGKRRLHNLALSYLVLGDSAHLTAARQQLQTADNMTAKMGALSAANQADSATRTQMLHAFYEAHQQYPLVVDKWLSLQATLAAEATLDQVKALLQHPAFDLTNPNKVRALIGAFATSNHVSFHAADGSGYSFIADQIIALNGINPQIAARIASVFCHLSKFDAQRRALALLQIERILAHPGLVKNLYEILSKAKQTLDHLS